ncbi:MFS transporter [Tistrella mobilis]
MTATVTDPARAPGGSRRAIALLSLSQGFYTIMTMLLVTVSALAGHMLAEDKSLATLPFALTFIANTATTIPASMLMARQGRRAGFALGACLGIAGALLAAVAIAMASFLLLCAAMVLVGMSNGFSVFLRHAAGEAAPRGGEARAIAFVISGGLLAALVGPTLAGASRDAVSPYPFLGTYLVIAGAAVLMLIAALALDLRKPAGTVKSLSGGLGAAFRRPRFVIAILAGITAYTVMNLLMTATPLAMVACGLDFTSTAQVIQWHVLGMFAPALIVGRLIERFGLMPMMLAGCLLMAMAIGVGASGISVWHFRISLTLLGLGWSALFVGATTLVSLSLLPAERGPGQAANDFLVFGLVALSAFFSGQLIERFDWATLTLSALPPVALTACALAWLWAMEGTRPRAIGV